MHTQQHLAAIKTVWE